MQSRLRYSINNTHASAYARELRAGVGRLKFPPALEKEYRRVHLDHVRLRVRIWFSLNLAFSLAFLFTSTSRQEPRVFWIQAAGILPCALVLTCLVWSRGYLLWYVPVSRCMVPVFSALVAFFIASGIAANLNIERAGLEVHVIAVFFFSGLLFRASVLAAVCMLATFALASLGLGLPSADTVRELLVMLVPAVIGAVVYWDIESIQRKSFLEEAFINELAAHDGLTGLLNRRAFDEHLARVWKHAQGRGRLLALLLIDIDHFKAYNDSYGHLAGDAALRAVAATIGGFAKSPLDAAARYGGEEFAVILYDQALADVLDIAERLRAAVENLVIAERNILLRPTTISVGVAMVKPILGRSTQGIVRLADSALYEAKYGGRNIVKARGAEDHRALLTGSF